MSKETMSMSRKQRPIVIQNCPRCDYEKINSNYKFCPKCGKDLSPYQIGCSVCDFRSLVFDTDCPAQFGYCAKCGTPMDVDFTGTPIEFNTPSFFDKGITAP